MKKNIINCITAALGALLITSCGEDFLKVDFPNILPSDFMYADEENVFTTPSIPTRMPAETQ